MHDVLILALTGLAGGALVLVFAVIAAITLGHMSGALALLLATVAWFATALTGYVIAWFR